MSAYGIGDTSFQAAGGETGVRQLVDNFYDRMGSDERFEAIYNMHPPDKSLSRDKLATFLCGWLGGPRLYQEKYGGISIPAVHQHLSIGESERDQWLQCMSESIEIQPYAEDFKQYLLVQLSKPAEMIRRHAGNP